MNCVAHLWFPGGSHPVSLNHGDRLGHVDSSSSTEKLKHLETLSAGLSQKSTLFPESKDLSFFL